MDVFVTQLPTCVNREMIDKVGWNETRSIVSLFDSFRLPVISQPIWIRNRIESVWSKRCTLSNVPIFIFCRSIPVWSPPCFRWCPRSAMNSFDYWKTNFARTYDEKIRSTSNRRSKLFVSSVNWSSSASFPRPTRSIVWKLYSVIFDIITLKCVATFWKPADDFSIEVPIVIDEQKSFW